MIENVGEAGSDHWMRHTLLPFPGPDTHTSLPDTQGRFVRPFLFVRKPVRCTNAKDRNRRTT